MAAGSKWGLSTLVEKTAQYGRWPLEREMAEDHWQPSLRNFLPSRCQSILVTLKLYFIFLFLVSWTRTRMTNGSFQCFRFSLVQTEHKCDKAWMPLPQSSGGGRHVKALADAVGTWLGGGGDWLVGVRCEGWMGVCARNFEIQCKNLPWLMTLRKKKKKKLKKSCSKEENCWKSHV